MNSEEDERFRKFLRQLEDQQLEYKIHLLRQELMRDDSLFRDSSQVISELDLAYLERRDRLDWKRGDE